MRVHLHDLLDEPAARRPDRPALTVGATTLRYGELAARVHALAAGLRRLGLERGDRVAVALDKRVETVESIFATSAAGGVFVPVNPALKPAQVRHVIADCGVRVLVTTVQRWHSLLDQPGLPASVEVVLLVDDPGLVRTEPDGPLLVPWREARRAGPGGGGAPYGGTDLDLAAILYTSGSTGRPKGVVLTHRNLLAGAESVAGYLEHGPDDVVLAVLPLSFDAGLSQLTTTFAAGAHVVLVNYLAPADVVRLCVEHGVTGLTGVPPLWAQLVGAAWPTEGIRLRYVATTGGRLPRSTLARMRELLPQARPYLMYGLTEAFRSTYLDPAEVDRRPDSIGKAVPGTEILVLRPDGSPAAAGEEGELVHRGPLVAVGYWNDAERSAERFRPLPATVAGWRVPELAVWSGDTVRTDDEGFLYFVGRRDEMIKTSGYRVSPTEVEEAAHETGLVGEAVALGIDDERLGQRIVLVVSPPAERGTDLADTAALLGSMRRRLPLYMVPGEVHVRAQLPRSPNGKLDRVLLREEIS